MHTVFTWLIKHRYKYLFIGDDETQGTWDGKKVCSSCKFVGLKNQTLPTADSATSYHAWLPKLPLFYHYLAVVVFEPVNISIAYQNSW